MSENYALFKTYLERALDIIAQKTSTGARATR